LVCIPALLCLLVPSWVNSLWFPALIRTKWGGPDPASPGDSGVLQLVMGYGAFVGLFASFAAFAAFSETGMMRNSVSRESAQSALTVLVFACWLASTVRISAQRASGSPWLVMALAWTFLTGVCSLQVQASAKGTWSAVKSLPVDPDGLPVFRPDPYVCAVKKSGTVTGRPVFVLHVADRAGAWRPVELINSPSDRIARAPWVPFHLPRTSYYTFLAARRTRVTRNGSPQDVDTVMQRLMQRFIVKNPVAYALTEIDPYVDVEPDGGEIDPHLVSLVLGKYSTSKSLTDHLWWQQSYLGVVVAPVTAKDLKEVAPPKSCTVLPLHQMYAAEIFASLAVGGFVLRVFG
jgi:hypothetical protein